MVLASGNGSAAHTATLLVEIGAILFALGVIGRVAKKLRIPVIPLYLLAGLFFGQGGVVKLEASEDFLSISSEIGVVLLLVMLGLEYSAGELLSSVRTQAPIGLLDGVANAIPGAVIALVAGWGGLAAVALAGVTWVSSSGVIAKMLGDLGRLGNREVPSVLGVLVLEDLAMALYLPLLTALLVADGGASTVIVAVLVATGTVGLILVVATRFGTTVTKMFSADDPEPLLLGVLGLTLLVAGLADQLKVSAAVGAFLVGIALSGAVAETAVEVLAPLRDLFAAVFFVTFGLSTSPGTLLPAFPLAILLVVVTSATKVGTGYVAARRVGVKRRGRWRAGVALIPRGEFSVVIASLAVTAGVEPELGPVTACYVLLTIAVAAAVQKLPDRLAAEARWSRSARRERRSRVPDPTG
ncbi:MAG TPA: cation:proton antiporter [Jatrophihabitans sp.]|jgi:CPA2 family monovalent cation:H+ antiporter-2|uniref:cation:proton antiporter n=1 Tax=Jatrophihabitans sp. TaxID=1932789 RepID=UPI002DF913DC|nr:cation:proton antiporter [Jatrophihabitans sp.]